VNSFEVISVNGKLLEARHHQGYGLDSDRIHGRIRMGFKEFIGKSVFHCHILPREDTGMMQNFLIKRRDQALPCPFRPIDAAAAPPPAENRRPRCVAAACATKFS
jgi:hypothetical protein